MTTSTIFTRIIRYGAVLALAVAVLGSVGGLLADGTRGLTSALIGAAIAFFFTAVTAASILLATRVTKGDMLNPGFFGIVLGGWLIKFVVFLVLLIVLKDMPWINTIVLFICVVVSIIGSLVVDVLVIARSRLPYVDTTLPGEEGA